MNSARAMLVLSDWHERERSADEISRAILKEARKLPGVRVSAGRPGSLGRRGFGRPVQAVLGGPEYTQLSAWSKQLVDLARANPGLTNVDSGYKERKPQIRVAVDRDRAAELGVSLQTVGRTLETVLGSRIVTTYVDRGREYNVVLQASGDAPYSIDAQLNAFAANALDTRAIDAEAAHGGAAGSPFARLAAMAKAATRAALVTSRSSPITWTLPATARVKRAKPAASSSASGSSIETIG